MPIAAVAEDPEYGNSSSLNETGDPESELFDLMDYNIEVYNQNLNLTPGFFKSLVGDEQILFVITLDNNEKLYALGTTEDAEFIGFERLEALPDQESSLTVRSDESTVRSIIASSSPLNEFNEAIKSGKITVEDASFLQKLMLWAIDMGLADLFM
ncbi:hypothetical protein SDC9_196558 [bioreactor metagenome]|uniref:SCP2 domain-containing protein n=1 Tax=bioreactor metagenome TaxID=1076179 RepID=A0A645ICC7_9ZZZZ